MKRIILTICALFTIYAGQAQGIAFGVRSGIGNTLDIKNLRQGAVEKTWDKELFGRYETQKRLALELSGTQYQYDHAGIWHNAGCIVDYEPLYFAPPSSENLLTTYNYNMVDIGVGIQYHLSCPVLREKCPLMKNFRSYIGLAVVGTYGTIATNYTDRRLSDGAITETKLRDTKLHRMSFGAAHTATYSFKHIFITSTASYTVDPWAASFRLMNSISPNSKLSLRLGVGYKL